MRILLMVTYFSFIVALGTQYHPPDIVLWAMIAILIALGFYADVAFSLPQLVCGDDTPYTESGYGSLALHVSILVFRVFDLLLLRPP